MPNPNKQKGTGFERELVHLFKTFGLKSKRAWGSNGEALGHHKDVDVLVENRFKVQCKRMKKLPLYLGLTSDVDCAIFREDRGEAHIMLRLGDFLGRFKDGI